MGEVGGGGDHHSEGGQCSGQRDHHLHCNGRLDIYNTIQRRQAKTTEISHTDVPQNVDKNSG